MRTRISILTAATLIVGFAIASLTGNRALGGVVLVAGGALSAWWMYQFAGVRRTIAVVVIVFGLFVLSHPLGHLIGAWPSVFTVAAIGAAIAYSLAVPKSTADTGSASVEERV
jgi:hypothetical protein